MPWTIRQVALALALFGAVVSSLSIAASGLQDAEGRYHPYTDAGNSACSSIDGSVTAREQSVVHRCSSHPDDQSGARNNETPAPEGGPTDHKQDLIDRYPVREPTPLLETPLKRQDRGTDATPECTDVHSGHAALSTFLRDTGVTFQWILRKDVILVAVILLLLSLSVSAVIFVYGFTDICVAMQNAFARRRSVKDAAHQVPTATEATEKPALRTKHSSRTKTCTASKSTSRKKLKTHGGQKSKHEMAAEGKREINGRGKRVGSVREIETTMEKPRGREDPFNGDAAWQEVHRQKGRGGGAGRTKNEEEKATPPPLVVKTPSASPPPSPPPAEPPTIAVTEALAMKPIRTTLPAPEGYVMKSEMIIRSAHPVPSGALEEHRTGVDPSATFFQPNLVHRSPFALSKDVPFVTSSPVSTTGCGGRFPVMSHTTDEQFQSKVDCLLRNLKNKPFSAHPVSCIQRQPLRRAVTDLDERTRFYRSTSMFPQLSIAGGDLDPALSSSGLLNNRVFPQPTFDDHHRPFPQRFQRQTQIHGQRAGSMPLTPPAFLSKGSVAGSANNAGNSLTQNCSLFSSNPSIWSVDLAVDSNLVKSSLANDMHGSTTPQSHSTGQTIDYRRCLPEQLLSEVTYPDP